MKAHNKETQATFTPERALQYLQEGNQRFVNNLSMNRNLLQQVNETRDGQWPFATILSCMDSRTSTELIFDQGLGDIFSIRIAGNIVNDDILGSLEYACKVVGSKLILVLGHTSCGAVKGAYENVQLGNVTSLLNKILPPIEKVRLRMEEEEHDKTESEILDEITRHNVIHSILEIINGSPILHELLVNGEIGIAGGIYSVNTGEVDIFYNATTVEKKENYTEEKLFV